MIRQLIGSSWEEMQLPCRDKESTLIVPSQSRKLTAQIHYLFNLSYGKGMRIQIDLAEASEELGKWQNENSKRYPLDFKTLEQWRGFCIGPHSDIDQGNGLIHVGQRSFHRFVEIDIPNRQVFLVDPMVGGEFLSSSNWVNSENGDFWFASWSIEDSIRRIADPEAHVRVKIWKVPGGTGIPQRVWEGELGDFLHQLNISPDRRFLVLCEMGMRPHHIAPDARMEEDPESWRKFRDRGIIPSGVLIADIENGREYRVSTGTPTAAHVEFDPDDSHTCYISSHNAALVHGTNALFGKGKITRFRIGNDGPTETGFFSAEDFYRITSHIAFRHRGRVLIGVTGYPDKVFLIDAGTMTLYRKLGLYPGDKIDTESKPHFCMQEPRNPYGLGASMDGELLYVVGSGILYIINVASGALVDGPWSFYKEPECEAIAGHLTVASPSLFA